LKPELATSASAKDFDGQWSGHYSWDSTRVTSVEIAGTKLKVKGLPVETSTNDQIVVISEQGEARFESQYGSKNAPCVLLYFSDRKEVVPLFISKDKARLVYIVDINLDRQIVFTRGRQGEGR
jgi:hypothetical protein